MQPSLLKRIREEAREGAHRAGEQRPVRWRLRRGVEEMRRQARAGGGDGAGRRRRRARRRARGRRATASSGFGRV